MMDMLDGLYYTYYWKYRNDGEPKWGALVSALILINAITLPYVAVLWLMPYLLASTRFYILGVELPMYLGFFLVFAVLCCRFAWGKRYDKIISQHDKYDNEKYKRIGKIGMNCMWVGVLILLLVSLMA